MKHFKLLEKITGKKVATQTHIYQRLDSNGAPRTNIYLYPTAFANCQTFVIAPFRNMFISPDDYKNVQALVKELRSLAGITKRMCQVDVRKDVFEKIKPYIKVHAAMDYVNLTGSQMVTLIMRVAP